MKTRILLYGAVLLMNCIIFEATAQINVLDKGKKLINQKSKDKQDEPSQNQPVNNDQNAGQPQNNQINNNNGSDREAQWQKDEDFMSKFRKDCQDVYDQLYLLRDATFPKVVSDALLSMAKNLDYTNRKVTADAIVKFWTPDELSRGWIWQNYVWVAQNFWNLYNDLNSGRQKTFFEDSYANANRMISDQNYAGAMELAIAMKNTIQSLNLIENQTSATGQLYADAAEEVYNKAYNALKTNIFTSDFHANNAGKIVFSKSPITVRQEQLDALTGSFKAGDDIYLSAYLLRKLENLGSISILMFLDGKTNSDAGVELNVANATDAVKSCYAYALVPSEANSANKTVLADFAEALANCLPGEHKVLVQLQSSMNILASGEFTIDLKSGKDYYRERAEKIRSIQLDAVRLEKPAMSNPALEQSMMKITGDQFPDMTPLRVSIADKNWTVVRHEITGEILYRTIGAEVAVKTASGKCKVFYLGFKQDYNGSAYGPTEHYSVGGSYDIRCENVNK